MTTRTITVCDRCHREISSGTPAATVEGKDLCDRCNQKLHDFLSGSELEIPP